MKQKRGAMDYYSFNSWKLDEDWLKDQEEYEKWEQEKKSISQMDKEKTRKNIITEKSK